MSRRHPGRSQTSKSQHGTEDDRPEYDHNTQHLSLGCTPPTSLFFHDSSSSSYYYSPPIPDQAPSDVVLSREEKTASVASDASWIPWEPTTFRPLKSRKPSRDVSRSASAPAPDDPGARATTVDRRTTGRGKIARPSYGSYDDSFYGVPGPSQQNRSSFAPPGSASNLEDDHYYGNSSKFSTSNARKFSTTPVRRSQTSDSTVTSSSGTMVNSVFSDHIYSSPKSVYSELRAVHVSPSKRQGSGTINYVQDTSLGRTKGIVRTDRTSTASRCIVSAKGIGHSERYSRESWKSAPDVGTWSKEHQFAQITELFEV
ncbi:hypothetical protein EIP86_007227 [Pleurotus ostreatoroseus]|nr:hypothetical protein EIP86_007227 [Pleurotus ostreatoroseus]